MKIDNDNIVEFKMTGDNSNITESDVNHLFAGLVKLVKRLAYDEARKNLVKEQKTAKDYNKYLRKEISRIIDEKNYLIEENTRLKKELGRVNKKAKQ